MVINKHVAAKQVSISMLASAHAPVVFLAVAAAERIGVKHTDGFDRCTFHQHAESNTRWDLYGTSAVNKSKHGIKFA